MRWRLFTNPESGLWIHSFFRFLHSYEVFIGKSPLDGTIFIDPDIITSEDPTSYQSLSVEVSPSEMYDRRSVGES